MMHKHRILFAFIASAALWLMGGVAHIVSTSHGFHPGLGIYVMPFVPFIVGALLVAGWPASAFLLAIVRRLRLARFELTAVLIPGMIVCGFGLFRLASEPPDYAPHFQRNFLAALPASATDIHIKPKVAFEGPNISYGFRCSAKDTRVLIKQLGLVDAGESVNDFEFVQYELPLGGPNPETWKGRHLYWRDDDERQIVIKLMTDGTSENVIVATDWMSYKIN